MITGIVQGQRLRIASPTIAGDSIDYLTAHFVFRTPDWQRAEKWTHWSDGNHTYDIQLTNDRVGEEDHLNLTAGKWEVWLHGNIFEGGEVRQRITTEKACFTVAATGSLTGEVFPEAPVSEIERIYAEIEELKKNSIPDTDGITADIASLQTQINTLEDSIPDTDNLTEQIASLQTQLDAIEDSIPDTDGITADIADLQTQINTLENSIPDTDGITADIADLQTQLDELENSIPDTDGITADIASLQTQLDALEDSIPDTDGITADIADLQTQINTLEDSIPDTDGITADIASLQTQINTLEDSIPDTADIVSTVIAAIGIPQPGEGDNGKILAAANGGYELLSVVNTAQEGA